MDPDKYEYQSRFARRYAAQGWRKGKAEGTVEGRAALIVRQLTLRFGPPDETQMARIKAASVEELDAIGERLLTAATLQDALQRTEPLGTLGLGDVGGRPYSALRVSMGSTLAARRAGT